MARTSLCFDSAHWCCSPDARSRRRCARRWCPLLEAYKEVGTWTQAQPSDRLPRDNWWTLYQNEELNDLEKQLLAGNPNLATALANYAQAKALTDQARAGLFPTLAVNGAIVARTRVSQRAAD